MKSTLKFRILATTAGLFSMLCVGNIHAGNTWDGGGASGSWSDLSNWDANTAPVAPALLTFGGGLQLASNNDLFAPGTTFNGMTFASGAGAFSLSGNSLTLGGNVTNSSSNLQTIGNDLILSANRTFTSTTGNIAVGGVISGAFQLTKGGNGTTLTLTGANSFSNGVRVDGGILSFATIADAGTNSNIGNGGNITVNAGTLQYTGATASSNRSLLFINNAQQSVLEVNNAGTNLTLSGNHSDNDTATLRYLVKTGSGTLTMTGISAGSGLGVAVRVDAGTVVSNSTAAANFGRLQGAIVNNGGTLQLTSASNNQVSNNLAINSGGVLDLLSNQNVGSLSTSDTGGIITTTDTGVKTLGITSSTTNSAFGGVIQNGAGTLAVTKSGAGTTLTLSGANTYTGATLVNAGTLLVNGSLASGSVVSVANTSTLGGTGTIGGATTLALGSKLSAGDNNATDLDFSGTLDISAAANDSAAFVFELGTTSDRIDVANTLTIGSGTLNFEDFAFSTGAGFGLGTYTLFDNAALNGTLGSSLSGTVGGFSSTLGLSGNDIILTVVPEPSTALLLLGGLAILLGLQRRGSRRAAL